MKAKKLVSTLFSLTIILCFAACESFNSDWYGNESTPIPAVIGDSLRMRFPEASSIEWEIEEIDNTLFYLASFRCDGFKQQAWYSSSASWKMTVAELPYKALNEQIKAIIDKDFNKSETEVYRVQRPCFCTMFFLDNGRDLLCLPSGFVILDISDGDALLEKSPIDIPQAMLDVLYERFPAMELVYVKHNVSEWEMVLETEEGYLYYLLLDENFEVTYEDRYTKAHINS